MYMNKKYLIYILIAIIVLACLGLGGVYYYKPEYLNSVITYFKKQNVVEQKNNDFIGIEVVPTIATTSNEYVINGKSGYMIIEMPQGKSTINLNSNSLVARLSVDVSNLNKINDIENCVFYVPNKKFAEAKIDYKLFSAINFKTESFGIDSKDQWGQLVCKNIDKLEIELNQKSDIFVSWYTIN